MTRFALDKFIWTYGRDAEFRAAFDEAPTRLLDEAELDADERRALRDRDIRAIFSLGAHPFLVYSFAIQLNGGWSYQFMLDYVERLKGLELGDIET
jgi:protocatechuate 4,5-dioxygenase alpha chain